MSGIRISGIKLVKGVPPSWDERLDPFLRVMGVSSSVVWSPSRKDNIDFGPQEIVVPLKKSDDVVVEVMAANLVREDVLVGSAEISSSQINRLLKSPEEAPMEILLKIYKTTASGIRKETGELSFLAQGCKADVKASSGAASTSTSTSISTPVAEDKGSSSSGPLKISKDGLGLKSSVHYVRPVDRPKSPSRPGYIYLTDHNQGDHMDFMLLSQPKSPAKKPKARRGTTKSSGTDTRDRVVQTIETRVHEAFADSCDQADIELPVVKPESTEIEIQTEPDPEEERRRRMKFDAKTVQTQAPVALDWLRESAAFHDHEVISRQELDRMLEEARNSQPPTIVYVEAPSAQSDDKNSRDMKRLASEFEFLLPLQEKGSGPRSPRNTMVAQPSPRKPTIIEPAAPEPEPEPVPEPRDLQREFFDACRRGNVEELAKLLGEGCDVNMLSGDSNRTPLHIATFENQLGAVQFLLANGAIVDARDNYGNTSLHLAAHYGFDTIVRELLANNADRTLRNNKGKLPVDLAIEGRRPKRLEIIKMLLGIEDDESASSQYGVKTRKRLRLTPRKYDRHSGLLKACRVGDLETATNILSFVPYAVFEEDSSGWTAFHMATSAGWPQVVSLLYDSGSEIDRRTRALRTPLHIAAYRGHPGIVEFLLDVGADITSQDGDGDTALHHACYWGFIDIVEKLITRGAQAQMRNNKGETAFDVARKGQRANRQQILDLLLEFNTEEKSSAPNKGGSGNQANKPLNKSG